MSTLINDTIEAQETLNKIRTALIKENIEIHNLCMSRGTGSEFFFSGVISSPIFDQMPQLRRHEDLCRRLKPCLTKRELAAFTPLICASAELEALVNELT